ncbi:hypothetical protein BD410DRAFT_836418 [Rickenella mellea]|uniref:F-box domain-containing protein n=1 Tax=Rickenella mellea TaxID=50990 RepID=A0A4Y7QFW7_9AGAM|nr:hypothetical protein BD410DRAFT_836418 [Rickenella mellea]
MTPSLPTELLKTIIRYATHAGVDPYPAATPANPCANPDSWWFAEFEEVNLETMKTKIALTRVSRRFRRMALEFLFEFVSIQKLSKALKLIETIKKQSSNIELGPREWVKFLFVRQPESNMRLVTKILHLCRGLRGFSWTPTASQTRFKDREAAQDEVIQNIPTNIQFLHWSGMVQFSAFAALLQRASASLRVLCTYGLIDETTHPQPI